MNTETHRQCEDCLAWVPKEWETGKHTCQTFIKALVARKRELCEHENTELIESGSARGHGWAVYKCNDCGAKIT